MPSFQQFSAALSTVWPFYSVAQISPYPARLKTQGPSDCAVFFSAPPHPDTPHTLPWSTPDLSRLRVSFHHPPFDQLPLLPRTSSPALPALPVKLYPAPIQFTQTFSL